MSRNFRLASAFVLATTSAVALAQVQPLPSRPIQPNVQTTPPRAEPLQIVEAPSGTLFIKDEFGLGTSSSGPQVPVRTTGGSGTVTLTIAASGTNVGRFQLLEPVATTTVAAAGMAATIGSPTQSPLAGRFNPTAADVSKRLVVLPPAIGGGTLPPSHPVTITARDSAGNEVRRTFTASYTFAVGTPRLAASGSARQSEAITTDGTVPAAAAASSPEYSLITVPYNIVEVREATAGVGISWHPQDPQSEVICVYGTFRYKCDFDSADFRPFTSNSTVDLPRAVRVRVPDIGRGSAVQIILKGPYGESNPVAVTINSRTQLEHRLVRSFNGPTAGAVADRASPASAGILEPISSVQCGRAYIVWDNLTTNGQMFSGGERTAPINLRLMGDATVRVVDVPKGQRITSNTASWARIEFNVPAGLLQGYTYFLQHSYFTRIGECPERRR